MYGWHIKHLDQLCLCLDHCHQARLSLNPTKCAFYISSGTLLVHIVSCEGISMDPEKVQAILNASALITTKSLRQFLGQIKGHSRMLRYLNEFATLLHATVHRVPF